jgi:hypothetical protein
VLSGRTAKKARGLTEEQRVAEGEVGGSEGDASRAGGCAPAAPV